MKKPKSHWLVIQVKGASSAASARTKVLTAFALREPDGVSFHLQPVKHHKNIWMEGAKAGTEIAFDLIEKGMQNLRKMATGKTRK